MGKRKFPRLGGLQLGERWIRYQASSLLTAVQTSTMLPQSANLRISLLRKQLHLPHYRRVPTGSRHRSLSTTSALRQDPQQTKISSNYTQPAVPRTRQGQTSHLPVYSLIGIFCLGTFLFYRLTKAREGQGGGRHNPDLPRRENPPTQFDPKRQREA